MRYTTDMYMCTCRRTRKHAWIGMIYLSSFQTLYYSFVLILSCLCLHTENLGRSKNISPVNCISCITRCNIYSRGNFRYCNIRSGRTCLRIIYDKIIFHRCNIYEGRNFHSCKIRCGIVCSLCNVPW